MGKSTILTGPFSIAMLVYQRVHNSTQTPNITIFNRKTIFQRRLLDFHAERLEGTYMYRSFFVWTTVIRLETGLHMFIYIYIHIVILYRYVISYIYIYIHDCICTLYDYISIHQLSKDWYMVSGPRTKD